jgi:Mor family transcriptional regulator
MVADMIKMQDSGYKLKDIAKKYNTSQSYACTMIKQLKGGLR